jgi:hypothetical protein
MTTATPASFTVGSRAFSAGDGEFARILNVETVRSHTVPQVWIPRLATVERVPAESLSPAQPPKATSTSHRETLTQERENLLKPRTELHTYDETLRPFAEMKINFNLDGGAKASRGNFSDLLAEVKAVCGTGDDG